MVDDSRAPGKWSCAMFRQRDVTSLLFGEGPGRKHQLLEVESSLSMRGVR